MTLRRDQLDSRLACLEEALSLLRPCVGNAARIQIDQWRSHAAALRFHLRDAHNRPLLVAVLGGTGTGKSTMVNRLVGIEVSTTSFRRTFTNGPVAVAADERAVPDGWLGIGVNVAPASTIPVRGLPGALLLVLHPGPLTAQVTLVDTPDLDGDQPAHHAQADRVFRWADAVTFLVTPEKYQMTEWSGYARLAMRYELPSLFVMNKCEYGEVLEDFREQLRRQDWPEARVFAIPRDDVPYEPLPEDGLAGLQDTLLALGHAETGRRERGLANRCADLLSRLDDRILAPLSADRRVADELLNALRAMQVSAPGVDVGPLTEPLQRRMQEQSVLYLMGPKRIVERVRQVPALLARLPRTAWDLAIGTRPVLPSPAQRSNASPTAVPDFPRLLRDEFVVVQSRIDDMLRSSAAARAWIEAAEVPYQDARIDPAEASRIAEEELADLKAWLDEHWNNAPRDTRTVEKLLAHLPGGRNVSRLSEIAPYLLAAIVVAHGAFFGPIDLLIIGGFSLVAWVGERLSNEITARARQTNRRMSERFDRLSREQVDRVCDWLNQQVPSAGELGRLERLANEIARCVSD